MDDVTGGISTFYAEILRIKEMAEYISDRKGIPALCLIDEIFKGTNSADRIVGAEEALKNAFSFDSSALENAMDSGGGMDFSGLDLSGMDLSGLDMSNMAAMLMTHSSQ